MTTAIDLRGVGKRYQKSEQDGMLLRSIMPFARASRSELWALRDLTLSIKAGEMVGVIGHNGAGKTTLLRLLAGVTNPTTGRVRVVGRIAPLISLGVGFHEEMSGRENVLVNGMLLGLTARQVADRFESIVDFAELWDFIDTPVKFYSSGMTLRLGFAVVAHVEPSILLVDEILAVGDASFQLKCFDRLRAFQHDGAAILVVSHSPYQIRKCQRAVLIRRGRLDYDGDVETAIARYETLALDDPERPGETDHTVEILERRLHGAEGDENQVDYDQPLELHVRLRFHRRVEDPQIGVGILTSEQEFAGFNLTEPGTIWRTFGPGDECRVRFTFPARLAGRDYDLVIGIMERDGGRLLAREVGPRIRVRPRDDVRGLVDVAAQLTVDRL